MHPSSPITNLNYNFHGSLSFTSPHSSPTRPSLHPAIQEVDPKTLAKAASFRPRRAGALDFESVENQSPNPPLVNPDPINLDPLNPDSLHPDAFPSNTPPTDPHSCLSPLPAQQKRTRLALTQRSRSFSGASAVNNTFHPRDAQQRRYEPSPLTQSPLSSAADAEAEAEAEAETAAVEQLSSSPTDFQFRAPLPMQRNRGMSLCVREQPEKGHAVAQHLVPFQMSSYSSPNTPIPTSPLSIPRGDDSFDPLGPSDSVKDGPMLPTIIDSNSHDLKCISSQTMADIVQGKFHHLFSKFVLVDCRYPYEYEGGHVRGAINIPRLELVPSAFFNTLPAYSSDTCIIFYCEFSSHRGPKSFRQLRSVDRKRNEIIYPTLSYPNVYLMSGGYRKFFAAHKDCCDPKAYIEMNDPKYTLELKAYTSTRRMSKRSRSLSELVGTQFHGSPS